MNKISPTQNIWASNQKIIQKHLQKIPHTQNTLSKEELERQSVLLEKELKRHDALLIAHYYTDGILQQLAEKTGGMVGDSLEMARFGQKSSSKTLIIAGVRFMGETAKILSPEKRIFMLEKESECSLDLLCPHDEFLKWRASHPDRLALVYANTSAKVKAASDWVVTSSSALKVVRHLQEQGHRFLFAPDLHLGNYIQKETGADMLIWEGACIVHEEFQSQGFLKLKKKFPDAMLLAHPEAPEELLKHADFVGSTTALIEAAKTTSKEVLIVATERGIFHKMQAVVPHKRLIEAPTKGLSGDCQSCAHCPWMAMNKLDSLKRVLQSLPLHEPKANEITLDADIINQAKKPIERLLSFQLR